tara:strand:+ start:18344 stop:19057 length:714 start_codon:yes stop_codon:yes gene_type:complete
MKKQLTSLVKDKNVILVGNSVEILHYNNGKLIDSYDTVVRFGKGFPNSILEHAIGKRTDIWQTGILRRKMHTKFPDAKVKLFNRSRIYLDAGIKKHKLPEYACVNMFSDSQLENIFKEFNFTDPNKYAPRPSQGFIALLFFTRKLPIYKSLTLIGFDFFAKTYTDKVGSGRPYSWHKPRLDTKFEKDNPHTGITTERDHALSLEKEGKINWIKLSDFTEEDLSIPEFAKKINRHSHN